MVCVCEHMLTLEEKYVFRQFVWISPWPGQCNLPLVVKTEAVPLTRSGGTLGCFKVNIMLFQQHYKPCSQGYIEETVLQWKFPVSL